MLHTKKTIATILIILTLFAPVHYTRAIWSNVGSDFGVSTYKQMLEEIRSQVVKALEASAKMMAIKQATSTIETLLYGGSSSPRNIKNFQKFLIQDPHEKTLTYAQDFLTNSLRGSTSGDYTSTSGSSGGDGLSQAIKAAGEGVISQWEGGSSNYDAYRSACSDPSNYFANGDFTCFDTIIETGMPFKMALDMDAVMNTTFEQEQKKAALEATSSGVLPAKDAKGNIINPKSIVEEIQLQRITLPLEALANGDSGAFSSLIQSFAVTLIVGVVERGLGEVEAAVDENVNAFERQYTEQMGPYYDKIGPAMNYANNAYDTAKKAEQMYNSYDANNSDNNSQVDNDSQVDNSASQMDNSAEADNPS